MFLSERGPHGCDSISLRLFPGKVAKIFRRGGFAHPLVPSLPPIPFPRRCRETFFPTVTLWRTLIKKRAAGGHLLLSECLSNPGEKMFPPNWPSPSPSMQQRRLADTSMPFRELRSWAPFYQHSEVLCSPDPSWCCCHVWFNAQQRDHPPSDIERARAGLRVPRHGAVHLRRRGLRFDGKSRQWVALRPYFDS